MAARANGPPSIGTFTRSDGGPRPFGLTTLCLADGRVAEVTTLSAGVFLLFGLG